MATTPVTPDDKFYEDMGKAQTLAAQATAYRSLINRHAAPPPTTQPPTTQPPSPDTTAPSAPTDPAATSDSPTTIKLTWTAPPAADGVTGYRVSRGGGFKVFTPDGIATTFVDSSLAPGSYYWYTVAAKDASGNWSAESVVAGTTTKADTTTPPPTTTPPVVTPPTAGTLPYGLSGSKSDYGPLKNLPARTKSGSVTVNTPGTVVQNLDITGTILVRADNVTVKNCTVTGTSRDGTLIDYAASKNILCEDVAVNGNNGSNSPGAAQAFGGWGSNSTFRRCAARFVANGIEFGSSGLVEWCLVESVAQVPGTTQHPDGIQTDGGGPYIIRNNYVDVTNPKAGPWQTSAIGMWADLGNLHDVLVEHNVVGPVDGFLFYCGTYVAPYTVTNVRFDNNVILRRPQGTEYGVWYSGSASNGGTHKGNVFADGTSAD